MLVVGISCIGVVVLAIADRSLAGGVPDQSLWSSGAKAAYASAIGGAPAPIGELSIERLGLRVPVFHGTDHVTLNRGAGVVSGTAQPGEAGNIAISAHRDGFFRVLKDIAVGDSIELLAPSSVQRFVVADLRVVDPHDVSVLAPSDVPVLTLITCFPFYYVGAAPDRFVVRAVLTSTDRSHSPASI